MNFYRQVVDDHIKDILDAYKLGKITHEKAVEKIQLASQYLYYNERYNRQKEQDNSADIQDNKS